MNRKMDAILEGFLTNASGDVDANDPERVPFLVENRENVPTMDRMWNDLVLPMGGPREIGTCNLYLNRFSFFPFTCLFNYLIC